MCISAVLSIIIIHFVLYSVFVSFVFLVFFNDFAEIVNYVGEFSRPLLEGWIIFQPEYFIKYGISNKVDNCFEFFSLCLQLSHLKEKLCKLIINYNTSTKNLNCKCSCKEATGMRKHMSSFSILNMKLVEQDITAMKNWKQRWN